MDKELFTKSLTSMKVTIITMADKGPITEEIVNKVRRYIPGYIEKTDSEKIICKRILPLGIRRKMGRDLRASSVLSHRVVKERLFHYNTAEIIKVVEVEKE